MLNFLLPIFSKFLLQARIRLVSFPGFFATFSKPAMLCAVASALMYALAVLEERFLTVIHHVAKPL